MKRLPQQVLGLFLLGCAGCDMTQAMLADSGDLADYRAYRVAQDQGVRLARAKKYLERHPRGTWQAEVQEVFTQEEAQYFEAAKESRRAARDYLTSLPDGPHAEQAVALLTAFDTSLEELELQKITRDARRTEAMLERASRDRKRVAEVIMATVAAMLDSGVYGASLPEASPLLRERMQGPTPGTWGSVPEQRDDDLFFTIPSSAGKASRVLSLHTRVLTQSGRVTGVRMSGEDLFLHWYESVRIVVLDPTKVEERTEAAVFAQEVLAGAGEGRFPAARCQGPEAPDALLTRTCDGLRFTVTAGSPAPRTSWKCVQPAKKCGFCRWGSKPCRKAGTRALYTVVSPRMIPYIHVSDLKIGPATLHPFGLLVASGVVLGTYLATKRARARGVDLDLLNSYITWMLVGGFAGAHMFDEIFYHPSELVKRPWSIFLLWEGLSSFGGFLGAIIGVFMWKYFESEPLIPLGPLGSIPRFKRRKQPMPVLALSDLIASVFPVAWILGRSGCTVVHDHPGAKAPLDSLFAVAYGPVSGPSGIHRVVELGSGPERFFIELRHGTMPQYDLGLLELMFTTVFAGLVALTWSKRLPTGTYLAAMAFSYGPVRFMMDFLRIREGESADLRYGYLTFAQWSCIALVGVGFLMVRHARQQMASGVDPMNLLLVKVKHPKPDDEPPLVGEAK